MAVVVNGGRRDIFVFGYLHVPPVYVRADASCSRGQRCKVVLAACARGDVGGNHVVRYVFVLHQGFIIPGVDEKPLVAIDVRAIQNVGRPHGPLYIEDVLYLPFAGL